MADLQETLDLVKGAENITDSINKAGWSQPGTSTTGLQAYNLEIPAKNLYPVMTPLRNKIPRQTGAYNINANWKSVDAIDSLQTYPGVSEGNRNEAVTTVTSEHLAAFRTLGKEDFVTDEAQLASKNFEDIRALSVTNLLKATMISEEQIDLAGNSTLALGTTGTPVVADALASGSLLDSTSYNVFCVGMTQAQYQRVAGRNNGATGETLNLATAALTGSFTRNNRDGSSDTISGGTAQKSAAGNLTTSAGTGANDHGINATVAIQNGAVAYAWYWGVPGSELLGAITTINSVAITATATGTQNISALPAADNSQDSLVYDGVIPQILTSGSGSYVADLATGVAGTGTVLSSDGAGGINEVNTALASFWDNYRISPSFMYVGAQVLLDMNELIIKNGGAPLFQMQAPAGTPARIVGNVGGIGPYFNKITNSTMQIEVHPNMPAGMIMFWSDSVDYPLNGIPQIIRKLLRQEYYQIAWPKVSRKEEFGVYFDGVLQMYFPPAFGIIKNIAPGV